MRSTFTIAIRRHRYVSVEGNEVETEESSGIGSGSMQGSCVQ